MIKNKMIRSNILWVLWCSILALALRLIKLLLDNTHLYVTTIYYPNQFIIFILTFVTIIGYWYLFHYCQSMKDLSTKECAVMAFGCVCLICFVSFMEKNAVTHICGYTSIYIFGFRFSKDILNIVWSLVRFPLGLEVILKSLNREQFSKKGLLFSLFAGMELVFEGEYLFYIVGLNTRFEMIFFQIVLTVLSLWRYTDKKWPIYSMLYIALRIYLYRIQFTGKVDSVYEYFRPNREWVQAMSEIIQNARLIGSSAQSASTETFLISNSNPIATLLYKGGWIWFIIFFLISIFYIYVLGKIIGFQRAKKHKNWVFLSSGGVFLAVKIILGFYYYISGSMPYIFPFLSDYYLVIDSVALGMSLVCGIENFILARYEHVKKTFISAGTIISTSDSRVLQDISIIKRAYLTIHGVQRSYSINWYMINENIYVVFKQNSGVFIPHRFILEYDNYNWYVPNIDIQKQVMAEYLKEKTPDCLEE